MPTKQAETMALTAKEVQGSKGKDKPYKLSDGGGLFLLVNPNGSKYWRLAYWFAGKQKALVRIADMFETPKVENMPTLKPEQLPLLMQTLAQASIKRTTRWHTLGQN